MESWRRNFHAVWPSLFATSMGLMAFLPVLALYVKERFRIEDPAELTTWTSIIYGTAPFSAAVAGPIWGALGDRIGKRPMAIRANLAIAATTALMPFAPTPWLLLVMRAVQGVLAGYVAPAMAMVTEAAPRSLHGLVIGRLQVAMAFGSFLGPYLGAEIGHHFGRASLFWASSVLSTVAAVQLWLFAREPEKTAAPTPHGFLREFLLGCREILGQRVFAWLLVLVLGLRLGQNMLEPFLALFVQELGASPWIADASSLFRHGVGRAAAAAQLSPAALQELDALALERTIGSAFAVLAIAQWVFTPLWGRLADRHGPLRCLAALGLGLGVVLAGTAAVRTIDEFLLMRLLAACFMAGSMTLAYAAASKRVAAARRTLAFSMVQSCMQFGFALGPRLGAWVSTSGVAAGTADLRRAFVVAGVLCVLAAAGMLWLRRLPSGRDEHAPPTGDAAVL